MRGNTALCLAHHPVPSSSFWSLWATVCDEVQDVTFTVNANVCTCLLVHTVQDTSSFCGARAGGSTVDIVGQHHLWVACSSGITDDIVNPYVA